MRRHSGVRPWEAFVLSNGVLYITWCHTWCYELRQPSLRRSVNACFARATIYTVQDLHRARSREANSTIDNKSAGHAP